MLDALERARGCKACDLHARTGEYRPHNSQAHAGVSYSTWGCACLASRRQLSGRGQPAHTDWGSAAGVAALVPAAVRQTRKEEEAGRRTQRNLRPHVHLRRHRLCDRDDVLCLHVPWTFGAKSARRWGGEDLQKLILNKGGVQTDLVHCPGGEGVSGEMGGDSLFFDYDCPLRTKKRDDIVLDIDWSTRSGEPARRAQGDSWLCSPRAPLTARALAQASPRARSSLWGRPTTACRSSKTRDTPWKRWNPRLASRHRRA